MSSRATLFGRSNASNDLFKGYGVMGVKIEAAAARANHVLSNVSDSECSSSITANSAPSQHPVGVPTGRISPFWCSTAAYGVPHDSQTAATLRDFSSPFISVVRQSADIAFSYGGLI
jgi:hypothetical protein